MKEICGIEATVNNVKLNGTNTSSHGNSTVNVKKYILYLKDYYEPEPRIPYNNNHIIKKDKYYELFDNRNNWFSICLISRYLDVCRRLHTME